MVYSEARVTGSLALRIHDNLIRRGAFGMRLDKLAPVLWRFDKRGAPSVGLLFDPGLELFCRTAQHITVDRVDLPVAVEEADHALGLLKRLISPLSRIRSKQR
jgi:hypothetical protein